MKTVLICNQKGGVGKTLIADELAFALERDGIEYNYYDLDSQGGSMHKHVKNDDAKIQIVDTPGALQKEFIQWIEAADMIIVPTKLTLRDKTVLETMMQILKPYKRKKSILYILNGYSRFASTKRFEKWLNENHSDAKTAVLAQSELFNYAAELNKSVCEYKPNSAVAQQICTIYSIVKQELKLS